MFNLCKKTDWRTVGYKLILARSIARFDRTAMQVLYSVYTKLNDEKRYELYKLVVKQRRPLYDALNVVSR